MLDNPVDIFREELNPGERLIWTGQPQQGFLLRPVDGIFIPMSLVWGGITLFWESQILSIGAPFIFILWGLLFALVVLYLIFGRFFVDQEQRRKTYYALTNERAIIKSGLFIQTTRSLYLKKIREINISAENSGVGTITFGPVSPLSWFYAGGIPMRSEYHLSPGFERIEDARKVCQQIKRMQRESL